MAIKKSQLYSTLWESCNALRGAMDASQYKDYVLIILFVKYLSDKVKTKQIKGMRVPPGCYFEDFVALKQHAHIGEKINEKLEAIREANTPFIGDLTLPNFNDDARLGSGKTKIETLSKLIAEFEREELDFSHNRAADDDLLGDAYEYLMKNFAVESGKSKGQFYTPAEVSRVMAKVLHMEDFYNASNTIYDMTCGSGSLLLRALSETPRTNLSIYGQEKDSTTASLAKLNMLLHGVVNAKIKIGDTLNDPQFTISETMLQTFDVCVANPPFSQKHWLATNGETDKFNRWNHTLLAPAKCGDFAFLQHLIASMKADTGRGACILPHGVLFRGNAEYTIRRDIIKKHYLIGIIGLPPNLFFGTNIPACILILDKSNTATSQGIFFIDAKEGYIKNGSMNRLREQDIKRIVDAWNTQEDIPHYARMVCWDEIKNNDYNLNIPRYVQPRDTELQHDIDAHLHGGLPKHDIDAMANYWTACPTLREELFVERADGRFDLRIDKADIATTISSNDSFLHQQVLFNESLKAWAEEMAPLMKGISKDCQPKQLINTWSERLLAIAKADKSLADPYAVYDHLMNYWEEAMQDDCYMISNDGWQFSHSMPSKGDYTDIVCDLLPVEVLLRVFFAKEAEEISVAEQTVDDCQYDIDSFVEEQAETFEDFEKVNEGTIKKALKDADEETKAVLNGYMERVKKRKEAAKMLKTLKGVLNEKVMRKYSALRFEEVRRLVVEEKWLYSVLNACREEMRNIAQRLTATITDLVARYERTLTDINAEVDKYEREVENYLQQMGFKL